MTTADPALVAAQVKRATALLREARSVLRRVDRLVGDAPDDPDLSALRDAAERAVAKLAQRERQLQRVARDSVRRVR